MDHFKTLIAIHGLRRADPARVREPVDAGEVIALPNGIASKLLRSGAVQPTDDEVTVELAWADQPGWVRVDDKEQLIAAIEALGADASVLTHTSVELQPVLSTADVLAALASGIADETIDPEAVRALLPSLKADEPAADLGDIGGEDAPAKPAQRSKAKAS